MNKLKFVAVLITLFTLTRFTRLGIEFFLYGLPVVSSGNLGTCPGNWIGYTTYSKTNAAWGYAPATNTTIHTAADGTGRTDTRVEFVGSWGDQGCAKGSVTVPSPPMSPVYRFTIYFTNNVPATNYPIRLTGFNP
jgi:hypothetical protein